MTQALALVPDSPPDTTMFRFIRKVYQTKQLERVELHHGGGEVTSQLRTSHHVRTSHVRTWNHDEFSGVGPEMMIRDIQGAAEEDTQGAQFVGKQRYVVLCFVVNERAPMRCIFQIEGSRTSTSSLGPGDWFVPASELLKYESLFPQGQLLQLIHNHRPSPAPKKSPTAGGAGGSGGARSAPRSSSRSSRAPKRRK
jgi:hypothetical protein